MHNKTSVVITSISAPNAVMKSIAAECLSRNIRFYVVGDLPSPADFSIEGCDFYSLESQAQTGFRFAELCPKRHYARKNLGYLLAIREGTEMIVETDDDNFPLASFWTERVRRQSVPLAERTGWLNVYSYFTESNIWPRGLPLDAVLAGIQPRAELSVREIDAPIQQGLADDDPDVDAIYRMVLPLPLKFKPGVKVALGSQVWCPFNSQNTTWWPEAFSLLYLPAYCSIRMTDIWRSFIAQRIAWENGWHILFESPTVFQERNTHNLMRDFQDEIPGYLNNRVMCQKLEALALKPGLSAIPDNLRICYELLAKQEWVEKPELALLDAWLDDLRDLQPYSDSASLSSV